MNKYQGIKLSDNLLMIILSSVAAAVDPLHMPYKKNQMMENLVFGAETFSIQPIDFAEMKNGQEIYKIWQELTNTAEEQKAHCFKVYNESSSRMIELENRINSCYAQSDALTDKHNGFVARKEACDQKIVLVEKSLEEMNKNVVELTDKIKKLEKDKETYDILRYIPVVNLISEIVAAIEGTRSKLQAKKNELASRKEDLQKLYSERNEIVSEMTELERQIRENDAEKMRLQQEREACLVQRNDASREMIDWKDREKYYLEIEEKMEHLIALEADVEEFRKLLIENPPKFQLLM